MAEDLVTLHEPLTRRELEILFCLDERLSNQEIADRFVLALSSVKWHIQQIFGKLDVKNRRQAVMRARELGLLKDKAGLRFPEHNLPALLTPFVGREEELEDVVHLIGDPACRLLTLIGPGGIGKTRLAIRAAKEQIGSFRHGVLFVSSAATPSMDYLVASIADAIPLSLHGLTSPQVQILNYLREKELLLVLDNFEHLLAPMDEGRQNDGPKLLVDLLNAAPSLKILVTSRERLNIKGEWLYEVEGLDTPPLSEIGVEISLENSSASSLFLQSARRVQPEFLPIKADKLEIVKLCRLVEGMPLAIELAAGWVRLLSCKEIVQEFKQNLGLLTAPDRDVPERHRSMQAVFDHSWQLLSSEEQRVFRKLAVFQGGFRREAAGQVCEASLTVLSALVDKSLLRRHPSGRYDLHELLRQYAAARLREAPEEEDIANDQHSIFYLNILCQQRGSLHGRRQREAVADLRPEIDNIRLAWKRGIRNRKYADLRLAMLGLSALYDILGWYDELETICRITIERLEKIDLDQATEGAPGLPEQQERDAVIGLMLAVRAGAFFRLGHFSQARELQPRSLGLLSHPETRKELALALFCFGSVAVSYGELAEAKRLLIEGQSVYQELEDPRGVALCCGALGVAVYSSGEYQQATDILKQSLGLMKAVDDQHYLALYLGWLGITESTLGNLSEADRLLREGLAISRSLDDPWALAFNLRQLGLLNYSMGNTHWAKAKRLFQESLEISTDLGDRANMAVSMNHLGQLTYALGDYKGAGQYYRRAMKTAMEAHAIPTALDALVGLITVQIQEQAGFTGPETNIQKQALERLAVVLDHPASLKETNDKAHSLVAEITDGLPGQVPAVFCTEGQKRKLEEIAAEIFSNTGNPI